MSGMSHIFVQFLQCTNPTSPDHTDVDGIAWVVQVLLAQEAVVQVLLEKEARRLVAPLVRHLVAPLVWRLVAPLVWCLVAPLVTKSWHF